MRMVEGGFEFRDTETANVTEVRKGKKLLGRIRTMKEASGRYCFRLESDNRSKSKVRTYRGRPRAARALELIEKRKREAKKAGLLKDGFNEQHFDLMIMKAWDEKPHTAP